MKFRVTRVAGSKAGDCWRSSSSVRCTRSASLAMNTIGQPAVCVASMTSVSHMSGRPRFIAAKSPVAPENVWKRTACLPGVTVPSSWT